MDFTDLQIFRDIARTKSISRSARLNGVSQSAVSQRLAELERRFSLSLLDRSRRPLRLTEAGRLFAEFCRDMLRRHEQLEAELERLRNRIEGTVRIASIYSVGLSQMARLEEEFRRRYPHAELVVEYLRPERVYEQIRADRADLGLISYPESSREIAVIPWRDEEMVVAVAPSHPLAGRRELTLKELDGQEFVGFDEDLPVARELERLFRDHGIAVKLVMHFDNVLAIKEAVALGSGLSILPEPALQEEVRLGRLVTIPLEEPGLRRPLGIIHRRRREFTLPMRAFLDLIRPPAPETKPSGPA